MSIDIDKTARDLPRMCLHGRIPTATTMALAARVVELLGRVEGLEQEKTGWDADEKAMTENAALLNEDRRILHARLAELEAQLRDGMPSTANIKDPVPQDQKKYRVWTQSRVVEWERGPNVWIARDDHHHDDAEWHATNCDGWLSEPDQRGEGVS